MKFSLKPQQIEFIGAPEQFPAYVAGIGTGKTTALIAKTMQHANETPNGLGIIVRKNFVDLRDSTMRDFYEYTGIPINMDRKEAKLQNGSVIMFRHGDELPVLKNISVNFFGLEQAEEFNDSIAWDMLTQRLRRPAEFRTGYLIANANGHNWIYNKWIKTGTPKNHFLVQATTYDFADILPPDYIENLEQNLPEKMFKRFVMNSHDEAEGLVYDEFLESRDIVHPFEISPNWERGFVLDHGFRNPTAVLWYAIDHDGNIIFYDEHYKAETPISSHAASIRERNIIQGLADPSIFSKTQSHNGEIFSIADEYKDLGIQLSPAIKENELGAIQRVNEFFKAGRIKIFKTMENTIQEIKNWKWKEMRPGYALNLPEKPDDKNNHTCDCIKYLVQTRFQASPRKVKEIPMHSPAWIMAEKRKKQTNKHSAMGFRR